MVADVGKYVGMSSVGCNFYIFTQPQRMLYVLENLMRSIGLGWRSLGG